tara:strand:- start:3455 stop:6178 length:2724 start_codon:yes stop_codon:yes gene_type:complete
MMREELVSEVAPEVLSSEEVDAYEALLAEEAAGRLKLHRAIAEKTASARRHRAALIIRDKHVDQEKLAVSVRQIRDAARSTVYKSPLRESTKIPKGQFESGERWLADHATRAEEAAARLRPSDIEKQIAEARQRMVSAEGYLANPNNPERVLLRESKPKIQAEIRAAKEEASLAGEPLEWRDYLPRYTKQRRAATALRRAKHNFTAAEKEVSFEKGKLQEAIEAQEKAQVLSRMKKDGFGDAATQWWQDSLTGKRVPAISIYGFKNKTPGERAIIALHEKREALEGVRHLRKGLTDEQIKRIGTDALGIRNSGHQNVVVPFYDLNIARTLTGEGSRDISRKIQALREPEILATQKLLPEVSPLLDQIVGQGVTYGRAAKPNYVSAAESMLASGKPLSDAVRARASAIVDSYSRGVAPNTRLNRREIDYVRQLSDAKFGKTAGLASAIANLQYTTEVAPDFQPYIKQKRKVLTIPIEDLPKPDYPPNDSEATREELLEVKYHMDNPIIDEDTMIMCDREPEQLFYITCEELGIDPLKDQAEDIYEDFNKIAFDLKYIFLRPRPWSLAEHHGVNLNVMVPPSADTPSYPSGHAMMGYGLQAFYTEKYPEYSELWEKLGHTIQHSRLQAGLHFPSDNMYSKQIVEFVTSREKQAGLSKFLPDVIGAGAGALAGAATASEGNKLRDAIAWGGAGLLSGRTGALTKALPKAMKFSPDIANFGIAAGTTLATGGDLKSALTWGGAGLLAGRAGGLAKAKLLRRYAKYAPDALNLGVGAGAAALTDGGAADMAAWGGSGLVAGRAGGLSANLGRIGKAIAKSGVKLASADYRPRGTLFLEANQQQARLLRALLEKNAGTTKQAKLKGNALTTVERLLGEEAKAAPTQYDLARAVLARLSPAKAKVKRLAAEGRT